VVHEIVLALTRTGVIDAISLGRGGDLRGRPGEPDDAPIEGGDVFGHHRRGVTLGIDRDEQRHHCLGIVAELVEDVGDALERGRADVGAEGIAEVDQQVLAAEVGVGDRAAVAGDQGERPADEIGAGRLGDPDGHLLRRARQEHPAGDCGERESGARGAEKDGSSSCDHGESLR